MPVSDKKKIVYLFGAGATHAEIANAEEIDGGDPYAALFKRRKGLLIGQVSKRVIEKAQKSTKYLKDIKMVSSAEGSLNIELLISLIRDNNIYRSTDKTDYLIELVQKDISYILSKVNSRQLYLYKSLLELHKQPQFKRRERLIGLISLNYDDVLDRAYRAVFQRSPNYCWSSDGNKNVPLLKLHGSFNWKDIYLDGKKKDIKIIPLGINKNYLQKPYNFIWGRALEILIQCDKLRVIGCSLSQNDVQLVDLLFKAHLERGKEFDIEIINSTSTAKTIKQNYGFFPSIVKPHDIKTPLIPDELDNDKHNAFREWLAAMVDQVLKAKVHHTTYLKNFIV